MATNDVKVTLTADDEATEIVRRLSNAVKQLDAQQRTANQSTSSAQKAASGAAGAFSTFQKAIAGVAAALGAIRIVEFVRDTIQATDEIGKMALKTGATTEALSVLAVAASTADLSQEELGSGLKFLSRAQSELQAGIPATVEAFQALGLSAKDLKGLSLDQVLVKVADAQEKFGDGAGKAAALMKIFGRNGTELIPMLHDLANGGFDQAAAKAKDLGLVISGDAAKSTRDFDDALATLRNSLKGVVIAFAPMIKAAADLAESVAKFVAHHQDLVAFAAALIAVAGALGAVSTAMAVFTSASVKAAVAFLFTPLGIVIDSFALLATTIAFVTTKLIEARNAKKALEAPLATDPTLDKALGIDKNQKPQVNLVDSAQRKALIDAQLNAAKQGAKDELAATQAGLNLAQEIENEFFAQGLTSLREFYAQRVAITKQGVAAQIAELEAQKQALTATPLAENTEAARIQRATELKSLEEQIAQAKVDGQTKVLALLEEERVARIRIADTVRSFQAQILSAQGQQAQAAEIQITKQVNDFILALEAQGGHTRDEIDAQSAALEKLLTTQASFAQAQSRANQETTSLDLARQAVQNKVAQGLISERDGQLKIAEIERERLPTLENLADQMDRFAAETKNPELAQAAEQFRASFANIGKVVDESTIKLANLKETLLSAAQSDLSEFLGSTISQVHSLGEAFKDLAVSIVSSFQRVLGDILATKAIEFIRGIGEAASTAPQVAAATATTGAATALSAAGTVVGTSAAALGGSAAALTGSGTILITAAGALAAAAAALAAAGATSFASTALAGGFLAGFASGGPISGPGTETSDSILARLSHGEYVIRAAAVRKFGVGIFDMLNGLKMPTLIRPTIAGLPGFATGGFVGGGANASISGGVDITVSAAPGSAIQDIKTRGGVKAVRDVVAANPNMFKAALGIP